MRLEEVARMLEAEVHQLRAENSRLGKLEAENKELQEEVEGLKQGARTALADTFAGDALSLLSDASNASTLLFQNARLVEQLRVAREALEFYSKESNYDTDYWHEERSEAEWDEGELARAALSQSETPKGYKENLLECPKCLQATLRERCRGAWDWFYHCKSCGWYVWTGKKRNFSEALKGEE